MDIVKELKKLNTERKKTEKEYYKKKEKITEKEIELIGVSEGSILDTVTFAEVISKIVKEKRR